MSRQHTYTFKTRKGIDDLLSPYAFHGNSQGDESAHNDIEQYKNSGGWQSFVFKCELTEEAIAAEIERRRKWNTAYVMMLKASGEYGKEVDNTLTFAYNPAFDAEQSQLTPPLSSYKMIFIDTSTEDSEPSKTLDNETTP